MDITIRRALSEDADDYAICSILCWQLAYKEIVPDEFLTNMLLEKKQRAEKFRKSFADPRNIHSYCVLYDKKMIGFLIIDILNAEIWAIYLIEEFWGKGYGKEILDFVINELKRLQPKEIFLWVFEGNNKARQFYEKNNFHFDGTTREREYGKSLVQLRYVLKL